MSKVFFFGLPSVSVHNTLTPVIATLAGRGHEVIYYNSVEWEAPAGAGVSGGRGFSAEAGGSGRPGLSAEAGGSGGPGLSAEAGGSGGPGLSAEPGVSGRPGFSVEPGISAARAYRFVAYPARFDGYYAGRIDGDTSYFEFGGILLGAADALLDFLLEEARRERPDLILHSHLAVWGKLLARRLGLPAVTLYSTFVLDERVMLPYFRRMNSGKPHATDKVHEAVGFHRKYEALYARLGIAGKPDLWDVYVNKGLLNICFILETFQPRRALFGGEFRFVGSPMARQTVSASYSGSGRQSIYVAMGTIVNQDLAFYRLCLAVLKECPLSAMVSLGRGIDPAQLGTIPENVRIVPFANQEEALAAAAVFITRGGMASVHEAIGARTPMIVIPVIPEQQLTAERIAELGIGLHLPNDTLSVETLRAALECILTKRQVFADRLDALARTMPALPPESTACSLIDDLLAREKTVIGRFLRQVWETPDAIAVRCGDDTLSYAQLFRSVEAFASSLRKKGIGKGDLIPVVLGPGIDILIAAIGIMSAGAAYVPVDPTNPKERIDYILRDTDCKLVIDAESLRELTVSDGAVVAPISLPSPGELAYVIYTSGSTGKPKGVMVEHRQIRAYLADVIGELDLMPCKSYAILGTFAADAGLTAVFAALCTGAVLHIIDVKRYTDFTRLLDRFETEPVDCYKITPSLLEVFLGNHGAAGMLPRKRLILGGEPCPAGLAKRVRRLLSADCTLINHYGPTETTVGVLTYTFPSRVEEFPATVPLGVPLPSVTAHILDAQGDPVEDGTTGELYVQGPLVARGYLHLPDLTAERFVALGSQRAYRTGDLVKRDPDGRILFLGRNDDQVKIRGYRIELKEVEYAILSYALVRQCIVLAKKDAQDAMYLVGYIVPAADFGKEALLRTLRDRLPDHMIPSRWVLLDRWPLTVNNKIDRQALPAPGADGGTDFRSGAAAGSSDSATAGSSDGPAAGFGNGGKTGSSGDAAGAFSDGAAGGSSTDAAGRFSNGAEDRLSTDAARSSSDGVAGGSSDSGAASSSIDSEAGREAGCMDALRRIWSRLLGAERIRPDDDFFALGGDSLKLMQLNYELSAQFSLEYLPAELMGSLTIGGLARLIDAGKEGHLTEPSKAEVSAKGESAREVSARGASAREASAMEASAMEASAREPSAMEASAMEAPQPADPAKEYAEAEGFDPELVSPAQRDLFLQKKLRPDETFPNSSITFKITGSLDPDRLAAAFATVIRANESLRTGYHLVRGKVCRRITEAVPFTAEWIACGSDDIDGEIRNVTRPFDFGRPPLLRAFILSLRGGERYLHVDMPHINSDGESLNIIMDELASAYNGGREDAPKLQYTDFQRRVFAYKRSPAYNADELFWRKQLSGNIPALCLGELQAGPEAAYVVTSFPRRLQADMNSFLRNRSLTRFQLLLAGYFDVIYRIGGVDEVCVLLPVHNRFEKGMERITGLLSNVVPVRMSSPPGEPTRIEDLKAAVLAAFRHQRYPFEAMRNIWRGNGYAGDQLGQVFFGYHQNKKGHVLGEARLDLHIPLRYKENLVLSAAVFETPGDLVLRISSRPRGFTETKLRSLTEAYFDALRRLLYGPGVEAGAPEHHADTVFPNTNL
jgi:MGT family glycosyltransferase